MEAARQRRGGPATISRSSVLVPPSRPTPYDVLPLTHGSVMAGLNTLVASHALVFDPPSAASASAEGAGSGAVIERMQRSLGEVLVPYYPLAGRIVENETGWEVRCDGRGAVFVVTAMPDVVDDLYAYAPPDPAPIPAPASTPVAPPVAQRPRRLFFQQATPAGEWEGEREVLVAPAEEKREVVVVTPPPTPPEVVGRHRAPIPALAIHLTDLGPGGLVVSIRVCHELCGAAGLVHFLSGWAEMARGRPRVSVEPVWPAHAREPAAGLGRVHFPSFVGHAEGPLPSSGNARRSATGNDAIPSPGSHPGPAFWEQRDPPHIDDGDGDARFGNIAHTGGGDDDDDDDDDDDGLGFAAHRDHHPTHGTSGDPTAAAPEAHLVASILGGGGGGLDATLLRLDVPFGLVASLARHLRTVEGAECSAAHALAAHVWREHARALRMPLDARARLFFACDLDENQPMAYHGAFKYNCVAGAKVADLLETPLAWAAERVKAAERGLAAHHSSFADCTEEFKHAHRNAETLLFTELPPAHELDQRLDFGAPIGKPHLPRGLLRFPAEVNVAAVARPTHLNNPPSLHIFFNNVPFVHADDLRRFICHPPFLSNTPSRM